MVGDVIEARVLYTDLSGVKISPVVILADVGMCDWIVCEITVCSQEPPAAIEIFAADFQRGGLEGRSWARLDRVTTLNESVFIRPLGRLAPSKQAEIAAAVRALFQRPPPSGFPRSRE